MPPAGRGFSYICPDGHKYALASAKHSNKFDILLSTFAIFAPPKKVEREMSDMI